MLEVPGLTIKNPGFVPNRPSLQGIGPKTKKSSPELPEVVLAAVVDVDQSSGQSGYRADEENLDPGPGRRFHLL
jgi:hypothetical protein